jgi:hypothetical protein
MIQNHIKKKILENSVSLQKFGLRDLAWNKEDVEHLISSIMLDDIGILGGDVYMIESSHLIPTYDNWSSEPLSCESKNDYLMRSKKIALDYINNYPINPNEMILFSLVFTEIID